MPLNSFHYYSLLSGQPKTITQQIKTKVKALIKTTSPNVPSKPSTLRQSPLELDPLDPWTL